MPSYKSIEDLPEKYRKQAETKIDDLRRGNKARLSTNRKQNKNRSGAKSGTKYGNQKVEYDGHVFDSKKEALKYIELLVLKEAELISHLKLQVPYELLPPQECNGHKYRGVWYIADFVYHDNRTNEWVVLDVKGYRGGQAYSMFKLKKKLMIWRYGVEIQEV